MLDASVQQILDRLSPDDLVLDIGAWGRPFNRANWVLDLMPYETRGDYGYDGPAEATFDAGTWVRRDICDRQPWPFEDDKFDFVICSHTLEDVRDPIHVCDEIVRVGKAGYVEVPSRLEEQSYGFQGPWVGWGHHHWLIDVGEERIDFVFKHHILHGRDSDHFPAGFQEALAPEQRVQSLWWKGGFEYRERVMIGPAEIDPYLADYVREHRDLVTPRRPRGARLPATLRRWLPS